MQQTTGAYCSCNKAITAACCEHSAHSTHTLTAVRDVHSSCKALLTAQAVAALAAAAAAVAGPSLYIAHAYSVVAPIADTAVANMPRNTQNSLT
jgi:hypothetical protein